MTGLATSVKSKSGDVTDYVLTIVATLLKRDVASSMRWKHYLMFLYSKDDALSNPVNSL